MENIKLRNIYLLNDIELAEKVMNNDVRVKRGVFSNYSAIYRTSNETINSPYYFDRMKDRKKVLSITGSGDQIINSILAGSNTIDAYDISVFPKYFVALKIAAIKVLNKEEFLDFLVGDCYSNCYPLGKRYYDKIRLELDNDSRKFWDILFNKYSEEQMFYSDLFNSFNLTKKRVVRNNPYLQEGNYDLLKVRLEDVNINLNDGDLFKIDTSKLDCVDLALLTNLINYVLPFDRSSAEKAEKYKEFLKRLPLNDNGVALTYNFIFDGEMQGLFTEGNYKVSEIDEQIDGINIKNEIIEYAKRKKISFFKKI